MGVGTVYADATNLRARCRGRNQDVRRCGPIHDTFVPENNSGLRMPWHAVTQMLRRTREVCELAAVVVRGLPATALHSNCAPNVAKPIIGVMAEPGRIELSGLI